MMEILRIFHHILSQIINFGNVGTKRKYNVVIWKKKLVYVRINISSWFSDIGALNNYLFIYLKV